MKPSKMLSGFAIVDCAVVVQTGGPGKKGGVSQLCATLLASNNDITFFTPGPERSCKSEPLMRLDPNFDLIFGDEPDLRRRPKSITCPVGCAAKDYQINEDLRQELVQAYITKGITTWKGIKTFILDQLSNGHPLVAVVKLIMEHFAWVEYFNLAEDELEAYLYAVEAKYEKNPYHDKNHAVDVTVTAAYIVKKTMPNKITPREGLGIIMGAAGHDTGHSGVSNLTLEKSNDPRALVHKSDAVPPPCGPNEQFHADFCEALLAQPKYDWMKKMARDDAVFVLLVMRTAVHNTDMALHFKLLEQILTYAQNLGRDVSKWTGLKARLCICSYVLHSADISNGVKTIEDGAEWAAKITVENKREGELLKQLEPFKDGSAKIPPHLERANLDVPASQIYFQDSFLLPTFEAFAIISEEISMEAIKCGQTNRAQWVEMQQMGVKGIKESLRMAGCSERLCSQPWDCLVQVGCDLALCA